MDWYLRAAGNRVASAFRPSTLKNHKYILKLFVGFALALRQDYIAPSAALIMAFIEHLAITQRTAASVLSSISTLKAVLHRQGISIKNFADTQVVSQLRSVKINKRTPALQRAPVQLAELRLIVHHLTHMEYAQQLVVAILVLFMTSFRQSNLAPSTQRGFDITRHLTRADVRLASSYVQIAEKWSKTRQQITRDRWIAVPRVYGSPLCLHAALSALLRVSPSTAPRQPLLTFDDGAVMPISFITKAFKLALARAGLAQRSLTLHSLRRGGARLICHTLTSKYCFTIPLSSYSMCVFVCVHEFITISFIQLYLLTIYLIINNFISITCPVSSL